MNCVLVNTSLLFCYYIKLSLNGDNSKYNGEPLLDAWHRVKPLALIYIGNLFPCGLCFKVLLYETITPIS